MIKKILVFPCGSEIGLEIHRSLRYSTHFELVGASSVDDHGRFVFEDYIGGLPFHDHPDFLASLESIVHDFDIHAIYPTMDAVAETLVALSDELGCRVIGSDLRATSLCASKSATYGLLENVVPLPRRYAATDAVMNYPIFIKPDRGYGARNSQYAATPEAARDFLVRYQDQRMLLMEYLPGREWTVDCFSDRRGVLRFHAARGRDRISNGISVRTAPSEEFAAEFADWAQRIHDAIKPRGAWFFQAREDAHGQPRLLEVAARLGGSSGLFRCMGINFAMLTAFDAFDQDVHLVSNRYPITLDRALANRYHVEGLHYTHVYVDLDDCLLIRGAVNPQLVGFLYKTLSEGKGVTLLTRHARPLTETLQALRIEALFDRVMHLTRNEKKSDYIDHAAAIFIDDSFAERQEVAERLHMPVFAPDMLEALI